MALIQMIIAGITYQWNADIVSGGSTSGQPMGLLLLLTRAS